MAAVPNGVYAGSTNRFDTAGDVINSVAVECGLGKVADPFAAAAINPDFQLLCDLLSSCGREIAGLYGWQSLTREVELTLDGSGVYDLPADFRDLIPDTATDPGTFTAVRAVTPAEWQKIKVLGAYAGITRVNARVRNDRLEVYPDVAGTKIKFEYRSRNWAKSEAAEIGFTSKVSAAADRIMLDPLMIQRRLKLAFRDARGFDTTANMEEWITAREQAMGADVTAPTIDYTGPAGFRLLDEDNLPVVIPDA